MSREPQSTYVLGTGSNIHNPAQNDPGDQFLYVENALKLPCYIRFKGANRGDEWKLLRAGVFLNDDSLVPIWDSAAVVPFGPGGGIWMGTRATEILVLPLEDPLGAKGSDPPLRAEAQSR